jgi:hypothetical protein
MTFSVPEDKRNDDIDDMKSNTMAALKAIP